MTVLSGAALRQRMFTDEIDVEKRLVVTPVLSPDQVDETQASIDLRLGSAFLTPRSAQIASIDLDTAASDRDALFERTYVPLGRRFVLHPDRFVLAETLEYVRLPHDLMGYVVTKSSWGRIGLIVATAVGVHPNYRGIVTLELRNLGDVPLQLVPGTSMLQLFFHQVSPEAPEGSRRYDGSTVPGPPQFRLDPTLSKFANTAEFPLAQGAAKESPPL